MAKDTEKLIRQLSLISYLMAERRPVTALEIRRDVEGYSGMNEDAFARRFYADRAELDSLGIQLTVDKPLDGVAEQENYSLRPENFHLPPIAFSDEELASLQFALTLLDGEFAYAEPLRLALQQISWGRPSPHRAPDQRTLGLGITGSAGGHELSQRLA
jgi:predicted DNA-binding transcriptional regulator YafY